MSPRNVEIILPLVCIVLVITYCFVHFSLNKNNVPSDDSTKNTIYIEKRNEMSRQLNLQRQLYGQQNCELKALQAKYGVKVSCELW